MASLSRPGTRNRRTWLSTAGKSMLSREYPEEERERENRN